MNSTLVRNIKDCYYYSVMTIIIIVFVCKHNISFGYNSPIDGERRDMSDKN